MEEKPDNLRIKKIKELLEELHFLVDESPEAEAPVEMPEEMPVQESKI